jgi:hypothetical protein
MTQIELRTRVGPDGILTLSVPVGIAEANREVKVVVQPAEAAVDQTATITRDESERFVDRTAEAGKGDLERPEPVESEMREQEPSQEYPTATFIEPTEYDWNENIFKAEQAVRRYLEESHADH